MSKKDVRWWRVAYRGAQRSTVESYLEASYFIRISGGFGQATWMVDPTYNSAIGIIRIVRETRLWKLNLLGFQSGSAAYSSVSMQISNNQNIFCASLNSGNEVDRKKTSRLVYDSEDRVEAGSMLIVISIFSGVGHCWDDSARLRIIHLVSANLSFLESIETGALRPGS